MSSPARRHQMRVLAEQAAQSATYGQEVRGTAYELMLRQLGEHKRTLKGIQSIERRIEAKRAFVPVYADYLNGALAGGQGAQDTVLVTLMLWHLDLQDWGRALELARYVIQHGMALPEEFSRNAAALLMDHVGNAVLDGPLAGAEALQVLGDVAQLTEQEDAPDQARAKLFKATGYALMGKTPTHAPDIARLEEDQARAAMASLTRARALWAQVGVAKDMERLERRLKNAAPAS